MAVDAGELSEDFSPISID